MACSTHKGSSVKAAHKGTRAKSSGSAKTAHKGTAAAHKGSTHKVAKKC